MESIKGVGAKVGDLVSGMFGMSTPSAADQTEKAIGPIPDGATLGTTNDARGIKYTSAGGRRLSKMKKTRKGIKKSRKTRRKH